MSSKESMSLVIRPDHFSGGRTLQRETTQIPSPEVNEALVKVLYAAQNPTDVQSFDSKAVGEGGVLGCDFVGTVEQVGAKVTRLQTGDTVAGLIWGGETKGKGAFSHYTVADEEISFKVPDNISLEQAATVPLAATTAWLALFSSDCLNIPRKSSPITSVLIWGGNSSVGRYAIQIAAMYNFDIITTCSTRHFDAVKALGAKHVFDYRDEKVVEKIKQAGPHLRYVFDTIGNETSSATGSQAIAEATGQPGALCTVRPGKANTEGVNKGTKVTDVLVWTAFLKEHRYGDFYWPPNKDDHELCKEFFDKLPKYLQEDKLKPNVPKLMLGLDAVQQGFQEYRDGKISGYKVVYKL
ncbi:hypothetical protein JX265_009948 [Neoarthrinium moseri]|uniref:Enoyl reductase (ER) domain-containing protein n=1 Tax=Neoarthrinium moseri TaxID=1658444 RepID=A0A9P9WFP2_9PEZI|nr:hypothetical protein JX265_009948 [Neoarthrinium moseri]